MAKIFMTFTRDAIVLNVERVDCPFSQLPLPWAEILYKYEKHTHPS